MRQIKFKAKELAEPNRWMFGSLYEENGDFFIWNKVGNRDFPIQVIKETISQFTGLVDADSQYIYENDIIESEKGTRHLISYDEHEACFKAILLKNNYLEYSCNINQNWINKYNKKVVSSIVDN